MCVHLSVTGNGRDHPCARNFADGVVVAIGDQEIGIFVNCPHTHAQNKRTHTNNEYAELESRMEGECVSLLVCARGRERERKSKQE